MFKRLINDWATQRHKRELEDFTLGLAGTDGSELGLLVGMATSVRHDMSAGGL